MLGGLLKRFRKRSDDRAVERATAEEQMSPDERQRVEQSIDDLQADNRVVLERGPGIEHLEDDSEAPRP